MGMLDKPLQYSVAETKTRWILRSRYCKATLGLGLNHKSIGLSSLTCDFIEPDCKL